MKISVIIPALNEVRELPETIARLNGAFEIIVADGGSTDGTGALSEVRLVDAPRGRALQMNTGAARATGDIFLFVHADTWVQAGWQQALSEAVANSCIVGGAFERRFRTPSLFLTFTCTLAAIRNRAIGWHLGDQAIFCRAPIFHALGGFKTMEAFEDLDFSRRLARKGSLVTLRPPVLTSARRFDEGPVKRTVKDLALTTRYLLRPKSFRI